MPGRSDYTNETLGRLLALAASPEPLPRVLEELLRISEERVPDMHCSIHLADLSAGVLRACAAPSLPRDYTRAIEQLPIAEGIGSCGTAAARRELVVVPDIAASPFWRTHTDVAREHGLAACWSVPLLDFEGGLLGTCAMYYSRPRAPTEGEERLIRVIGSLATMVIRRHRDAERLRASEAQHRALAETCPDPVLVHAAGSILYANQAAIRLLHPRSDECSISQTLEELASPECRELLLEHRSGLLSATLQRVDGSKVHVEIAAAAMPMDGRTATLLVCRDVTERMLLEQELIDVVNREQTRMAHDLHDGLGQQLAGIGLYLRGMASQIVRQSPAHTRDFEHILALVSQSIQEARRLASGMSPIAIERAGFTGALTALATQARDLYGLIVQLSIDDLQGVSIESGAALHLYRIAQEATNNVARHAKARVLTLSVTVANAELRLTIADDGVGLPAPPKALDRSVGMGLRIMRYRAERLGGTTHLERVVPHGTAVVVCCPLRSVVTARGHSARAKRPSADHSPR